VAECRICGRRSVTRVGDYPHCWTHVLALGWMFPKIEVLGVYITLIGRPRPATTTLYDFDPEKRQ